MLGVVMVLGFMFGLMVVLGVIGWAVEKAAEHRAINFVEEIRHKAEDERRIG